MDVRLQRCRSCESSIIWTVTEKGKAMPVNATPDPDGNLLLTPAEDPREPPIARVAKTGVRELRFTSHFATCKQADRWRKKP